jgi:hypothetical protein
VVDVLTGYFVSIEQRDFATYRSLFAAPIRTAMDPGKVARGYRSTRNADVRLVRLDDLGGGRAAAWVDFTSTQAAVDGPDGQTCTRWSIGLFLQPEAGREVIGAPPSGYRATYRPC